MRSSFLHLPKRCRCGELLCRRSRVRPARSFRIRCLRCRLSCFCGIGFGGGNSAQTCRAFLSRSNGCKLHSPQFGCRISENCGRSGGVNRHDIVQCFSAAFSRQLIYHTCYFVPFFFAVNSVLKVKKRCKGISEHGAGNIFSLCSKTPRYRLI